MNGVIAWFAKNDVAANLLMMLIVALGLTAALHRTPMEVFPDIQPNVVNIEVSYRGASPGEVEQAITLRIEEAIADVQGIKKIYADALEGLTRIRVELLPSFDPQELKDDIKSRIDAINTLPDDAERPVVSLLQRSKEVISVVLSGELSERELRKFAEEVRDDLTGLSGVTRVELSGVRRVEISVEVSQQTLRQYNLTLENIAAAIRRFSRDVPSGSIKTSAGEVLLRTLGQAYQAEDFARIVVLSRDDGSRVTLADIAEIKDDFEEEPLYALFDGRPSAELNVYRVGNQSAIEVAGKVKTYIEEKRASLPPGLEINYWRDRSKYIQLRLNTLIKSAWQGGILIFILLTLFLRLSVAIWVCIGIPISFLGALALMPVLGVTFNLLSLFAFILVLGIVVDDAIVTGENIYTKMKTSTDAESAAIIGTQEISVPVTFGVLTTVAAFIPLMMMEGARGPIFAQIPMIVIPVLLFSLVESKLILPAHMKHIHLDSKKKPGPIRRVQKRIADGLEYWIDRVYKPSLSWALKYRYFSLSIFIAISLIVLSFIFSGRYGYTFFPRIQSETATVTLQMPRGTPVEITEKHLRFISDKADELRDKYRDPVTDESIVLHILTQVGQAGGSLSANGSSGASHIGRVKFEITAPEERQSDINSTDLVKEWRKMIGQIPGAKDLTFRAEIGHAGEPIDVQLEGSDFQQLKQVSTEIKAYLAEFSGVFAIKDSFEDGKEEIKLSIKPSAEQLGLDLSQLGQQVRNAFFGTQAQRVQRNRDDIRVMVRYTQEERRSLNDLESMFIRTPNDIEVPFSEVANTEKGRGFSVIHRVDRKRTINVTADINKKTVNINQVTSDLQAFLPELLEKYPGVRFRLEGEQREQKETNDSLKYGFMIVMLMIYSLLAIPFRSYIQPFIVMGVIPFSIVGAILGHMIMGMNLSVMSLMGMLALAGVVVNDSLVLVDFVNKRRREGQQLLDAISIAGVARFRPILLTSLTTFFGLTPLIFEKSTQAQFLIPMAVSLGFGILFATVVTLLLVPISYMILEDFKAMVKRAVSFS